MRLRQHVADRFLPGELAAAVHAQRSDRVVFAIRPPGSSVEHVVAADVQQAGARVARGPGEVRRAHGVHELRRVGLRLGAIHLGVAGAVDDPLGALARHRALDGLSVFDGEVHMA